MSAWTIYWILQLDNFVSALTGVVVLGGTGGLMLYGFGILEEMAAAARAGRRILVAVAVACVLLVFMPNTKTAAAMVIIPAIANNEALKAEAGDLYQLAKQALREAVTDKPESDE